MVSYSVSRLGTDDGAYSMEQLRKLFHPRNNSNGEELLKQQLQKGFPPTVIPIVEGKPEGSHDSKSYQYEFMDAPDDS